MNWYTRPSAPRTRRVGYPAILLSNPIVRACNGAYFPPLHQFPRPVQRVRTPSETGSWDPWFMPCCPWQGGDRRNRRVDILECSRIFSCITSG
ncbi:hypothetical protein GQ53DRAFT_372135 [Thozetella sp. PMI_491]|nr:hypothetical protein GQ53DRAFT_372135 [Thozetella sp. PMI_491]